MTSKNTFLSAYGSPLLGAFRAFVFLSVLATIVPVFAVCRILFQKKENAFIVHKRYYKALLWSMGFRVVVHGAISSAQPTLFVSNHISYLDIPVLGSVTPASFVAKAEVSQWPIIGFVAGFLGTIFIERRSTQAEKQRSNLRTHLERGRSLILFPEGTSSEGIRALPFKSSLFSIVEDTPDNQPMIVQPVSLTCTGIGALPIVRAWRPYYAWFGDMGFVGHLWEAFKIGHFRIDVIYHTPVNAKDFSNRKTLASYCHTQVARGIEASLKGRADALIAGQEEQRCLPHPA